MIKKKCCVFTLEKDENIFMPIWLKYYSKFFDGEDIYVLSHDSEDKIVKEYSKNYKFNHIKLHHETYDDIWKKETVCQKQAELLKTYEYVLFTDPDEIIIPNPKKYKNLKDYIEKLSKDCVACAGYELFHVREKEPAIDFKMPILGQRKYWYYNNFYCKPLLSKKPLNWVEGIHKATSPQYQIDKDLWLLHLHKIDFDICWQKHKRILNYKWNNECVKKNMGSQFRIDNFKEFEKFFDTRHPDNKKLKTFGRKLIKKIPKNLNGI